jgi:hypothetical protein
MGAACVRIQDQNDEVCSVVRQPGHEFCAKPGQGERQSRDWKPPGKAAQPTDISINRTHGKSQDKFVAHPGIRIGSVFGQGESERIYLGELTFDLTTQAGSFGFACPAPFL